MSIWLRVRSPPLHATRINFCLIFFRQASPVFFASRKDSRKDVSFANNKYFPIISVESFCNCNGSYVESFCNCNGKESRAASFSACLRLIILYFGMRQPTCQFLSIQQFSEYIDLTFTKIRQRAVAITSCCKRILSVWSFQSETITRGNHTLYVHRTHAHANTPTEDFANPRKID